MEPDLNLLIFAGIAAAAGVSIGLVVGLLRLSLIHISEPTRPY